MARPRTLCIDFDGVVHRYSKGFYDGTVYDPPTEGTVEALTKLVDYGYRLVLLSARAGTPYGKSSIEEWLEIYGLSEYFEGRITDKKPPAVAYIDDNAIRFWDWRDALEELSKYGEWD